MIFRGTIWGGYIADEFEEEQARRDGERAALDALCRIGRKLDQARVLLKEQTQ